MCEFMVLTATVSEIFGEQTTSSIRLVGEGLNPEKINIKVFWCQLMQNGITNNILQIPMNRIWGKVLAGL